MQLIPTRERFTSKSTSPVTLRVHYRTIVPYFDAISGKVIKVLKDKKTLDSVAEGIPTIPITVTHGGDVFFDGSKMSTESGVPIVGMTGSNVRYENDEVIVDGRVLNRTLKELKEGGRIGLSLGSKGQNIYQPGADPMLGEYDAIQRIHEVSHVALGVVARLSNCMLLAQSINDSLSREFILSKWGEESYRDYLRASQTGPVGTIVPLNDGSGEYSFWVDPIQEEIFMDLNKKVPVMDSITVNSGDTVNAVTQPAQEENNAVANEVKNSNEPEVKKEDEVNKEALKQELEPNSKEPEPVEQKKEKKDNEEVKNLLSQFLELLKTSGALDAASKPQEVKEKAPEPEPKHEENEEKTAEHRKMAVELTEKASFLLGEVPSDKSKNLNDLLSYLEKRLELPSGCSYDYVVGVVDERSKRARDEKSEKEAALNDSIVHSSRSKSEDSLRAGFESLGRLARSV